MESSPWDFTMACLVPSLYQDTAGTGTAVTHTPGGWGALGTALWWTGWWTPWGGAPPARRCSWSSPPLTPSTRTPQSLTCPHGSETAACQTSLLQILLVWSSQHPRLQSPCSRG